MRVLFFWFPIFLAITFGCSRNETKRNVILLNGTWEIAGTASVSEKPTTFHATVPVPGLVDLADGEIPRNYGKIYWGPPLPDDSPIRDSAEYKTETIFWYKRTFTLDPKEAAKDVVQLKINKSRYHTRVFLNGEAVGENVYCFTPSYFDLKPFIKADGRENELLIAVGCANNLPDTVVNGFDVEKKMYIPGIYDDVTLRSANFPFISNIQVVPDIDRGEIRVVAELLTSGEEREIKVAYRVSETTGNSIIATASPPLEPIYENGIAKVDFTIPLPGYRLWSPETPFLYDLELSTSGDKTSTRFGMRKFATDNENGVVLLNGKPYYMRGTNVCIYRFFEDSDRGTLPWDNDWVTRLHLKFKDMHWNSMRYCIGFPPERWYEIADSLGFLIQDEYPVWLTDKPAERSLIRGVKANHLAREYEQWMRERWNHPGVVIWDAQNETVYEQTGKAINMVRNLDLSGRPWENGWEPPAGVNDVIESHPYVFNKVRDEIRRRNVIIKENILKDQFAKAQPPHIGSSIRTRMEGKNFPLIVNEYCWMWLSREGAPLTLTENIYAWFFPEADTPEKKFEAYARTLAKKTEYWRSHRLCAGVLHFGALSFSSKEPPHYPTSDNWNDVDNLIWEPQFYRFVKPAFSPVGLMVDFWDTHIAKGSSMEIKIRLINDTYEPWTGPVTLTLLSEGQTVVQQVIDISEMVGSLGMKEEGIRINFPDITGKYELVAELMFGDEKVTSSRRFELK